MAFYMIELDDRDAAIRALDEVCYSGGSVVLRRLHDALADATTLADLTVAPGGWSWEDEDA